jgi:hypothetical protein
MMVHVTGLIRMSLTGWHPSVNIAGIRHKIRLPDAYEAIARLRGSELTKPPKTNHPLQEASRKKLDLPAGSLPPVTCRFPKARRTDPGGMVPPSSGVNHHRVFRRPRAQGMSGQSTLAEDPGLRAPAFSTRERRQRVRGSSSSAIVRAVPAFICGVSTKNVLVGLITAVLCVPFIRSVYGTERRGTHTPGE